MIILVGKCYFIKLDRELATGDWYLMLTCRSDFILNYYYYLYYFIIIGQSSLRLINTQQKYSLH